MGDPLSITAGITGLLVFAGTALTKGYGLLRSLQGSSMEVQRLLTELSQLTGLLCALEAQQKQVAKINDLEEPKNAEISTVLELSLNDCRKTMIKLKEMMEKLEKSRKAILAVKWQFLEPEITKMIEEITRYRHIFILCLGVDQRSVSHS
jgi:Fungal N-terminal domain of STAND proteins